MGAIEFTSKPTEDDFLQLQLYIASKAPDVAKKRNRSRYIVTGLFVFWAFLGWDGGSVFRSILFLGLGVLAYFGYPYYTCNLYKKHYVKHVRKTNETMFDQVSTSKLDRTGLFSTSKFGEGTINADVFKRIVELPSIYLIMLENNQNVMIPKNGTSKVEEVEQYLRWLAGELDIDFIREVDWVWE